MQRTLVDEKRWIGQRRFLHALNYCMVLPGLEAQQLATYVSRAGCSSCPGGRAACAVLALRRVRLHRRGHRRIRWARPAVPVIVAQAVVRVAMSR